MQQIRQALKQGLKHLLPHCKHHQLHIYHFSASEPVTIRTRNEILKIEKYSRLIRWLKSHGIIKSNTHRFRCKNCLPLDTSCELTTFLPVQGPRMIESLNYFFYESNFFEPHVSKFIQVPLETNKSLFMVTYPQECDQDTSSTAS